MLVLLIILFIIIGVIFWLASSKLGKIQKIDLREEDLNISVEAEESLSEFRNIAIFGIDSREDSYEKGNRSDGIIIENRPNYKNKVDLEKKEIKTKEDIKKVFKNEEINNKKNEHVNFLDNINDEGVNEISIDKTKDILNQINQYIENEKKKMK